MYYYFASLVLLAAVLALEYQFRRAIRTIAVFGVLAFILVSVLKYWLSYSAVALIMLLLASFFSMYWYAERRFYIFYAGIAAVAILFFVSSYYALGSSYTPISFITIGYIGLALALLLALLESIPTRADDNITVSLVYGVLASIFV